MKIRCSSISEFEDNLQTAKVYRDVVHFSREREPLNGQTPRDATSWDVRLRVSAVLEFEDGGQALLEASEFCGRDRETADGSREGSERQRELLEEVRQVALRKGALLLPGIVDLT